MFTGIIESMGKVAEVQPAGSGLVFWIESPISAGLKVDQSVSHDGVCLTVEQVKGEQHRITAVKETLARSNLTNWRPGTLINLERSMVLGQRLDGHFVQGHVDATGKCVKKTETGGSWVFEFEFPKRFALLLIEKGSITINGISLTVNKLKRKRFSASIIPYTYEHTNIHAVKVNEEVNLEFDIIGKYLQRKLSLNN